MYFDIHICHVCVPGFLCRDCHRVAREWFLGRACASHGCFRVAFFREGAESPSMNVSKKSRLPQGMAEVRYAFVIISFLRLLLLSLLLILPSFPFSFSLLLPPSPPLLLRTGPTLSMPQRAGDAKAASMIWHTGQNDGREGDSA